MTLMPGTIETATPFDHPEFDNHQDIAFFQHAPSGLRAIIAIHDTRLGPALGGCRMWPYRTAAEALTDVLRLSKGMTYKNALAGIEFGGGKAVILGDSRTDKSEAGLEAFGGFVDRFGGAYRTGEDVGMTSADMAVIGRRTRYALGTEATGLGDPSPYTALGVFVGIKAAVRQREFSEFLRQR